MYNGPYWHTGNNVNFKTTTDVCKDQINRIWCSVLLSSSACQKKKRVVQCVMVFTGT